MAAFFNNTLISFATPLQAANILPLSPLPNFLSLHDRYHAHL